MSWLCRIFMMYESGQITAQKMKFSIKDIFSKCDHIRSFLRICSHLLKKSLMENFIFSEVFKKVIGNSYSRASRTWQYFINSQVWYGCALDTDFDNRY